MHRLFISYDKTKISWSSSLVSNLQRGNCAKYEQDMIFDSMYRPFIKQHLYNGDKMIHRPCQWKEIFPQTIQNNLCICISSDVRNGFSCLISQKIPDLSYVAACQCFPLYYYDKNEGNIGTLFDQGKENYTRRDGIPLEAYDYVVNGRSAIEWIMDRYQVKIDKDSQIKNDPNDWCDEHNNPRYILDLILSLITVSIETMKIVKSLPKLEFR